MTTISWKWELTLTEMIGHVHTKRYCGFPSIITQILRQGASSGALAHIAPFSKIAYHACENEHSDEVIF